MSTITPDRSITIPAIYIGWDDATLEVFSDDGETATMTLRVGAQVIASGEGFRRPQIGPYTWWDAPEVEVAGTFGAFLAHAVGSGEPDTRDGWPVLSDDAAEWADACHAMGEDVEIVGDWRFTS